MRGCVTGLLVVIVLVAILFAATYVLLGRSPQQLGAMTPVIVSADSARNLDDKLATAASTTGPVTVEVTDAEATSKVAETLAKQASTPRLTDPQVNFRAGKVYLSGTSADTPVPVQVLITGRLTIRDGVVVMVVDSVDTGAVPLPASMKDQIVNAVAEANALSGLVDFYATSVDVLDGKAAIHGRGK